MTTVQNIVDRLYREWLGPADEVPVFTTLDGAVTAGDGSITIDTDTLSIPEQNLMSPGTVLEVNLEQMAIKTYNVNSRVATVIRGFNGTTAAAHSDEDTVYLQPEFPRLNVFDAVADEIISLHPDLWGLKTATTTVDLDSPFEVDADVIGVAAVTWIDDDNIPRSGRAELIRYYPPATTSERAVLFSQMPQGKTVYLTLKTEFSRPTDLSDNLSDLGVIDQWIPIVLYGAASRLTSYIDVKHLNVNWISELDEIQAIPPGTSTSISLRLKRVRDDLLEAASDRQDREYPPTVTFTDPFRSQRIV